MNRHVFTRYLLPTFAFLMNGCVTLPGPRLEVPFRPQNRPNHCGVNCLAMAFDYFSIPYTLDDLTAQAFVPVLDGSTPELLADVAEANGLQATLRELDAHAIKAAVGAGTIPILFIPPAGGAAIGHFILVTGAAGNPRYIHAHDGRHRHRRRRLDNPSYLTLLLTTPKGDHDETRH